MDQVKTVIDQAEVQLKSYLSNPYILGFMIMILTLYGSLAQQTLPRFMYKLFDNRLFTFIMFASIAFIGTQSWVAAFIVALIFAVIMHKLNQTKIKEAFDNYKEQ
jgi:type II secretory pathway component PulF